MKLVKFVDYKLIISEEALFIKAFADLWKRDRSPTKEKALQELGFIYFQYDPRSDYMFMSDEVARAELIKSQEGLPKNWKPDDKVLEAIKVYVTLTQTTSSLLLADTRTAINNLRTFLSTVDLINDVDDNGKPKYTVNSLTSALKAIPDLTKELVASEKAIAKEIEENDKMRGQKMKKIMEDGLTI